MPESNEKHGRRIIELKASELFVVALVAVSPALCFVLRNVALGEFLQLVAAQTDFERFVQGLFFAPALFKHTIDHHESADPIGGRAVNEHRVVGFFFDQSNELVRLFGARRAGYHRNIEVAEPGFFY